MAEEAEVEADVLDGAVADEMVLLAFEGVDVIAEELAEDVLAVEDNTTEVDERTEALLVEDETRVCIVVAEDMDTDVGELLEVLPFAY